MAEERNVGLARAPETGADADTDATKVELQRRMDEARESITQTVTEIKDTVVNQYQQVRESISETLDWREQYRRRPVPFTVGAFGAGFVLGYSVMGAFQGDDEDELEYEEGTDAAFDRIERGFDRMRGEPRSYAATPVIGAALAAAPSQPASNADTGASEVFGEGAGADVGPDTRPSYGGGYQATARPTAASTSTPLAGAPDETEAEEPKGPGLFERFKETKAYDRLQDELSTLGERVVEELSRTARTVVVPALLSKLKDMIGIDLSTQREVAQRSRLEQQSTQTAAATAQAEGGRQGSGQGAPGGGPAGYASGATGGSAL